MIKIFYIKIKTWMSLSYHVLHSIIYVQFNSYLHKNMGVIDEIIQESLIIQIALDLWYS